MSSAHFHQFDAIEAEDHIKEDGIDKPLILGGLYAKKFHSGETHEKESVKELLASKGVVGVSGSTVEKGGVVSTAFICFSTLHQNSLTC